MFAMMNPTINEIPKPQKAYRDGFSFESSDLADYMKTLDLLGENRQVKTVKMKEIVFKPMPTVFEVSGLFDEELHPLVFDSIQSETKVYVEVDGTPCMLRDTALDSIYDRLRIAGDALNSIPSDILASHLNDYAAYTPGEGLLIFNNGKVEAILGRKYSLVPAEKLMEKAADFFDAGAKPAEFVNGSYTHSYSSATWRFRDCKVVIPFDSVADDLVYEQRVCVSTSDNGRKAITISPQMRLEGDRYGLNYCLPLKLEHSGNTDLQEFEKTLNLIDKRFADSSECIRRMVDTVLDYPVNVLLAMLKFLKIPAKYGVPVYEKRKIMWGENPQTAYDVYSSLSEVLSLLMGESESSKELAEYRERFSRALKFDFSGHDLPGQYSYTDKYIGRKGV